MKQWTEEAFLSHSQWFHATNADSARKIISNGVIAKINRRNELDFGYGFYLTPSFEWSCDYLLRLIKPVNETAEINAGDGYIIEFSFIPNDYARSVNYKFFSDLDVSLARFIFKNRTRYKYHLIRKCVHSYGFVGGPMSDGKQTEDFAEYRMGRITKGELFERLLTPKEDWQLLLHDQKLCDKLKVQRVFNAKGDEVYDFQKELNQK